MPGDSYFLTLTTANIAGFWWRAGLNPYPDGAAFVSGSIKPSFDWGFRTLTNEVDAYLEKSRAIVMPHPFRASCPRR